MRLLPILDELYHLFFGVLSPQILTNSYNWNDSLSINLLQEIRNNNGDYKVSFGGWNNYSLASKVALSNYDHFTKLNQLVKLYSTTIKMTNAREVDFDIEGLEDGNVDDLGHTPLTPEQGKEAKQLRIEALVELKKEMPLIKYYIYNT